MAAGLVVAMHSHQMVSERLLRGGRHDYWGGGGFGVDIFFVISGFVMTLTAGNLVGGWNAAKRFFLRRVIRIIPMYWLATTVKLLIVLVLPVAALHADTSFVHLLSSYLLIPHRDSFGAPFPLLTVGWTLSYEFFFYAVFALVMRLRWSMASTMLLLFIALNFLNGAFSLQQRAEVFALFSPLLFEFVAGIVIAKWSLNGRTLPVARAWLLVVLGFVLFYGLHNQVPEGLTFRLFAALCAFMIVGGVVAAESTTGDLFPRWLREFGDASFSLYLFHPFVLAALGMAFAKLNFRKAVPAALVAAGACVLASLLVYRFVEKPMTRWLRDRVGSAPRVRSVPVAQP